MPSNSSVSPDHTFPVFLWAYCQAQLQEREQQLAEALGSDASNAQLQFLQAQNEQQGRNIQQLQQELEQVQEQLQQQTKAAATNKASATAAWWVAANLQTAQQPAVPSRP